MSAAHVSHTGQPPRYFSIARQFRYALAGLVFLNALLIGGILLFFSYQTQQEQLKTLLREDATEAAGKINALLEGVQSPLSLMARMPGLTEADASVQHDLLTALLRHNNAYQLAAI